MLHCSGARLVLQPPLVTASLHIAAQSLAQAPAAYTSIRMPRRAATQLARPCRHGRHLHYVACPSVPLFPPFPLLCIQFMLAQVCCKRARVVDASTAGCTGPVPVAHATAIWPLQWPTQYCSHRPLAGKQSSTPRCGQACSSRFRHGAAPRFGDQRFNPGSLRRRAQQQRRPPAPPSWQPHPRVEGVAGAEGHR